MAQCIANNAQDLSVEIATGPLSFLQNFSGEQ
jgi:hypothetical protein